MARAASRATRLTQFGIDLLALSALSSAHCVCAVRDTLHGHRFVLCDSLARLRPLAAAAPPAAAIIELCLILPAVAAKTYSGSKQSHSIMKEEDIIYLASAGYDHTIRFWSPHEGKCTRVIQHPQSQVNDLKITPDKQFLAAASFQHVRMYNILTVHNNNPEINLEGFNNNVLSIGFQEDSQRLFSGGEDCVTRVWDLKARKNQSQRMLESESCVNSVKLHSNQNELFIGQQHGHITIWDMRFSNATLMVRLTQQHPSNFTGVQCLSLNPMEDMLAAIDNVGHVHIFSPAQTLSLSCSWKAHTRYGIKCLFSPNGKYLVTTSADYTAKVWKTCDVMKHCCRHNEGGRATEPTTTTEDSKSTSPSNQQLVPFKVLTTENQRWVWDVAFSADSQFLLTGSSESVVRLWHIETAETRREYTGHQKAVTALAFSD